MPYFVFKLTISIHHKNISFKPHTVLSLWLYPYNAEYTNDKKDSVYGYNEVLSINRLLCGKLILQVSDDISL